MPIAAPVSSFEQAPASTSMSPSLTCVGCVFMLVPVILALVSVSPRRLGHEADAVEAQESSAHTWPSTVFHTRFSAGSGFVKVYYQVAAHCFFSIVILVDVEIFDLMQSGILSTLFGCTAPAPDCGVIREGLQTTFLLLIIVGCFVFFVLALRRAIMLARACVLLHWWFVVREGVPLAGTDYLILHSEQWMLAFNVLLLILVRLHMARWEVGVFPGLSHSMAAIVGQVHPMAANVFIKPHNANAETTLPLTQAQPSIESHADEDFQADASEANGNCADNGDCLAHDAVVWLEKASQPQSLSQVSVGDKVLCLDSLTAQLKYVDVVGSTTQSGRQAEWVTVTLEDGTQMDMTANHPVMPQELCSRNTHPSKRIAVRAADLRPEIHSVAVLRVVHVPVTSVVPRQCRSSAVSLCVQQPGRHQILAANASQDADGPGKILAATTMAVGSADLSPSASPGVASRQYSVKNTFLDFSDNSSCSQDASDHSLGAPRGRPPNWQRLRRNGRCASAPPLRVRATGEQSEEDVFMTVPRSPSPMYGYNWDTAAASASTGFLHQARPRRPPLLPSQPVTPRRPRRLPLQPVLPPCLPRFIAEYDAQFSTPSESRIQSEQSQVSSPSFSGDSATISENSGRHVQVGAPLRLIPGALQRLRNVLGSRSSAVHEDGHELRLGETDGREARLGDVLHLQSSLYASLGALQHQSGECKPCRFHNAGNSRCWKQKLCERCHDPQHSENGPRRVRKGRKKTSVAASTRSSSDAFAEQEAPQARHDDAESFFVMDVRTGKRLQMTAL